MDPDYDPCARRLNPLIAELIENLFYDGLDLARLGYVVETFARIADQLEERVHDGGDWY